MRTTSVDTTFCITAELMRLETETVGGALGYDIALVFKGIALPSANPRASGTRSAPRPIKQLLKAQGSLFSWMKPTRH